MLNSDQIEQLKLAFNDYKALRKLIANKELSGIIVASTPFLPPDSVIKQRIFHIVNNISHRVLCLNCNKVETKWHIAKNGYRRFCSYLCMSNNSETKQKTKNTNLERYGTVTTLLEPKTREKIRTTVMERYGVSNVFESGLIQNKIRETNMKRYGVDNPSKSNEIKEKITKTHLEKYNRNRQSQSHISDESFRLKYDKSFLEKEYDTKPIDQIAKELDIGVTQLYIQFHNLNIALNRKTESINQIAIKDWIGTLIEDEIKLNYRLENNKELDIFIPSRNLAIEYDGVYWHSEKFKTRTYHYNKQNYCREHNIRLLQVWDLDWIKKQEQVKSRIRNQLGLNKKIMARKCKIVTVHNDYDFMNQNHIQSWAASSIKLGLEYENQLVAVMTFGKSRFNKKAQYELIRYANILNTNVVGGASRLLKEFERRYQPTSLISYSDRRYNLGNLYIKLGFNHVNTNGPGYWYTDFKSIVSRLRYQKHKLSKEFTQVENSLSTREIISKNGFFKIYDSGQDVFIKSTNTEEKIF